MKDIICDGECVADTCGEGNVCGCDNYYNFSINPQKQ